MTDNNTTEENETATGAASETDRADAVDVASQAAVDSAEAAGETPAAAAAAELEKLRQEREDLYNRYLRAVADLDTYRRRVVREKDELRQFAVGDLVESLIPVFENLGLAIDSAHQSADPKTIATGVSMVLGQFRSALGAVGLVEIKPEPGSDFDPHQHESLAHAPSDTIPEEKIAQLVRPGFALNGRLVRPASVVLSSGAGE